MAATQKVDYLSAAAIAADKVYAKIVELKCVHQSGAKTYAQLVSTKKVTCASSASIAYQEAGILPSGKVVSHLTAVGGTDANILKKKPTIAKAMSGSSYVPSDKASVVWVGKKYADLPAAYRKKGVMYIQDSNVCICAGGGAIYSCNAATGSQLDSKGRYKKDKITSGYAFTSPILVVIVPKVQTVSTASGGFDVSTLSTIKSGSTGAQVKSLQILLNGKNNAGLSADGICGTKTVAAIKAYQQAKSLSVNGIAGINTWTSLLTV